MATALTALLVILAVAVFLPLSRATQRYHQRSDQQQQTEAAMERMTRMIEASKASAIRIYEYRPDSTYKKVLQTQGILDVGPEARTIWEGDVQFLYWHHSQLRYLRVEPEPAVGEFAGLRIYHPTSDVEFLALLKSVPSVLLCGQVWRWEVQGYDGRGLTFPLTLVLETRSPQVGDEAPYSYTCAPAPDPSSGTESNRSSPRSDQRRPS